MRDAERILGQIERGEVRAGAEAARQIARRVESQGGFWDFKQKSEEARRAAPPGALVRRLPRHLSLVHVARERVDGSSAVA